MGRCQCHRLPRLSCDVVDAYALRGAHGVGAEALRGSSLVAAVVKLLTRLGPLRANVSLFCPFLSIYEIEGAARCECMYIYIYMCVRVSMFEDINVERGTLSSRLGGSNSHHPRR